MSSILITQYKLYATYWQLHISYCQQCLFHADISLLSSANTEIGTCESAVCVRIESGVKIQIRIELNLFNFNEY